MNVFILASCPGPTLTKGSHLVFDTVRVGFPTANLFLDVNDMNPEHGQKLMDMGEAIGARVGTTDTIHHDWISNLLATQTEPFFILDTDVIFWSSFEVWKFDCALAGRRIPQFYDEFTRCITRPRLHTSLLYIDPVKIRSSTDAYIARLEPTVFNPHVKMVDPLCLPFKGKTYFHDTCSVLYNAIGGQPFTEKHLECYDHMNFGTLDHLVLPRLKDGAAMASLRQKVWDQPSLAKGAWREQDEYYESRSA